VHCKIKILLASSAEALVIYKHFNALKTNTTASASLVAEIGAAYTTLDLGVTQPSGFHTVGFSNLVAPKAYVPTVAVEAPHTVNIFRLGDNLEPKHTLQAMFILILVTIAIESIFEYIQEATADSPRYFEMFNKMTSELTILGIISFSIAMGINGGLIHHGVELIAFEFAHISIFFVAILYVFQSICVVLTNDWAVKRFHYFDTLSQEQIFRHHHDKNKGLARLYPGSLAFADPLFYRQIRAFFIAKHQRLFPKDLHPDAFDYALYLRQMSEYEVVDMLNIERRTWAVALGSCGVLYLYFSGPEWGGMDKWGHTLKATLIIGYGVAFLATVFCVQSRWWIKNLVHAGGHQIKYKDGKIDKESLWWWPSVHNGSALLHNGSAMLHNGSAMLHTKASAFAKEGEAAPAAAESTPQKHGQLQPLSVAPRPAVVEGDGVANGVVAVEGDGVAKGDVEGDDVALIHDAGSSSGIDIARPPPLMLGSTGHKWEPGDSVRVVKEGTHTGEEATVEEPDWSGRVKVKMAKDGSTKSYLSHEIVRTAAGSETKEAKGGQHTPRAHDAKHDAKHGSEGMTSPGGGILFRTMHGEEEPVNVIQPWLFRFCISCIEMFNTFYLTWFFAHTMMQAVDCNSGVPNEFCPEGKREVGAWLFCIAAPAPAVFCMVILVPRMVQNYVIMLSVTAFLAEHDSQQVVTFNKVCTRTIACAQYYSVCTVL
jgi:hypothetical protein